MIKEKVKALWKLCFDDSEEYVDMYFRLRYSNDTNIALLSGDEVISALQMLPYPMTFCGKFIQTSYISGACTHPDYRGKGVMRELLLRSFIRMLRNKIPLSTLIPAEPWLFDYYAHMGYAPVFRYSQEELSESKLNQDPLLSSVYEVSVYNEEVYLFLNRRMHERSCCIQHTKNDFHVILADIATGTSRLYALMQHNQVTGVAFTDIQDGHLYINELLADDKNDENALVLSVLQNNCDKKAILITPPAPDKAQVTLGMARIINAQTILEHYAAHYPETDINIELTDHQLGINNGYYYLCNGKCIKSAKRLPGSHLQLNIAELCEWVFNPLQPYMSLMLN